jgi:hypothetical protein
MSPSASLPPQPPALEPFSILIPIEVDTAALPRRLPRPRLPVSPAARELGQPEAEYSEIRRLLRALDLRGLRDIEAQLAAILTVARFYEQYLRHHARARNRANDLLTEVRTLVNRAVPWGVGEVDAALEAIRRLEDDPVLTRLRGWGHVFLGVWPIEAPLRARLEELKVFLGKPATNAAAFLRNWAREFEGYAAAHVGEPWLGAVDLDGIGRQLLPPGIPVGADAVPMWGSWAVMAVLERQRGSRKRVAEDAERIVTEVFPGWGSAGSPINVVSLRYRGWRAFFGKKAKARRAVELSFAAHPVTIWLASAGQTAEAFERLAASMGAQNPPPSQL